MTMQPYQQPGTPALSFGQTNLDASDFIPPRVKVVQQMSDEAQGKDAKAKPGDFFNTLTGENYGDDLAFIPISPFKQRILLVRAEKRPLIDATLAEAGWQPLSEGDGLKCRSFDMVSGIGDPGIACDTCPLSQWGSANQPPHCSETYNMAALTELGDLIILGFSKSSAKVGKKLFSMTRLSAGAPWTKTYRAATRTEKNDRGTFYVPDITVAGPTPTELLGVAANWARQLGTMMIDVSPTEDEGPAPESSDF